MIKRTTLREIKQSFGRYFAILAIVALGVALFAGLKIIKSTMVKSADKYLQDARFYDYRLLSTLGFEAEDVEAFAAKEDVRAVEGSVSADILFVDAKGNEKVIKAHTLLQNINGVVLTAGRLPEQPDECVVDNLLYDESAIGSKIILSDNNTEDDLAYFAYKEYTITGVVQSSYYIQFERGNTSLGNGMVSGFMYLLPEGFDTDYYTEIFVKFDQDYEIYSDAYEAYMEEKEPVWEQYCEEQGIRRYDAILAKANEELSDAETELTEKKAEAEEELADAKKELTDAETEIADGESELADGEAELIDAEKELADGEAELIDAENTIAEKEKELADAKAEIEENAVLLAEKKKEYEDGLTAYNDGKAEVEKKGKELEEALALIKTGEASFVEAQAQIDAMALVYPAEVVAAAQAHLDAQKAELATRKAQVEVGLLQIQNAETQLNMAYVQLFEGGRQIELAEKELADAMAQIVEGEEALADAKGELADGRKEIADVKIEIADAKAEIAENRQKLEDAKEEVADGWIEYNDGYAEFEEEIADAESKLADAKEEIADIKKPDTYVLGRDTNIGYVCFDSDSSIVDGIANVFPVFFFLVAALVCITTMNRMVEEQRTQIGVLKALGYKESTIMGKYLFYSGSAALLGCVIGYFIGTYFIALVIWTAYGIMYRMGDMVYVFDVGLAIFVLLCSMACSMGATYFSCRHELKEVAAGLMRPKAPKAGKRVFLEKVPFIWKRLKFLDKVSVRNIIRYKKRFFMMVIGISGCTGLLVTGFGVMDSITHVADQQYGEIQIFDIGITLQEGESIAPKEDVEALEGLLAEYDGDYMYTLETTMDFVTEGQIKSVNLVVAKEPAQFAEYVDLHTEQGEAIAYPNEGEIVICEKLSESYGLAIGDEVILRDEDMNEIPVKISGICENYIYNYVYIHPATYKAYMGDAEYKGIYVNLPQDKDVHAAGAAFMSADNVTAVSINEDMLARFSGMMDSMNYVVLVIIISAAALAFIVLYNLNNINITERIREIATIKVLGFYKKETTSYVFRENMVLTGIGCLLGLLLGKLLHLYVMHEVKIDMVSFDVQITMMSYLISIALTFVFNWFVNRIMTGKLEKINMAESLKSVD